MRFFSNKGNWVKASEDCQLFQPEKSAKNTLSCCKGHDFCVRLSIVSAFLSYNRRHELDYVLLCPLITSYAIVPVCIDGSNSKSQRGTQLVELSKRRWWKKGKAGCLKFWHSFVRIPFLLQLWWRYPFRKMGSPIEFVKWGRQWSRLVRQPKGKTLGTMLVAKEDRACDLSWATDKILSSYPGLSVQ